MAKKKLKHNIGDMLPTLHGTFEIKSIIDVIDPYTMEDSQTIVVDFNGELRKVRNEDILNGAALKEDIDEAENQFNPERDRFAALDFETMDTWRATVCSVGCAIFENGEKVDEFYSLVCPPSKYENPHCVETHGLLYEDVCHSPEFPEIWKKVHSMIDGCPVVAHNKGFEKSCIDACGDEFGTETDYTYIDTLKISRHALPNLYKHSLDHVCRTLGCKLKNHHNALDDARACGEIYIKLRKLARENAQQHQ